jgi:CHAT domain-containing protein
LHSGAESVLASLAPVSDAATLEFMRVFCAGLPAGARVTRLAGTPGRWSPGNG